VAGAIWLRNVGSAAVGGRWREDKARRTITP